VYFIKRIAVTYTQAREHLGQAQRMNEEEKLNKGEKPRPETSGMTQTEEAASGKLGRLLTTSNMSTKSIHDLAPSRPEEPARHAEVI
jgi:hypothetical protein